MKKNKKSDWGAIFAGVFVLFFAACFSFFGYMVGNSRVPSSDLEYVNFTSDGIHYIVFKNEAGGMFVVNQTIDSARIDQLKPKIFFK